MNKYFLDYSFGIEIIFNQLSKCKNYDDKYYYSITESNDAVYITFRSTKKVEDRFSNMKILPSHSRDIIDGYTHFGYTERQILLTILKKFTQMLQNKVNI